MGAVGLGSRQRCYPERRAERDARILCEQREQPIGRPNGPRPNGRRPNGRRTHDLEGLGTAPRAGGTTMQLGMVGLGRMGANIVRRLMRGGHDCVVWTRNAAASPHHAIASPCNALACLLDAST